jgi:hypothetical protein
MNRPDESPTPTPPVLSAPAGGALRALWHLLQPVLVMLLLLVVVGGTLGGAAVWLLRSAEGTAWLLARVPGLDVQGTQGALLSDRFGADRVVVRWDAGRQSVTIDGLQADGLRWHWHPSSGAWIGLDAQHLKARRVDVQTGPAGPRPVQMPRTLQLPLRLQAARVDVAELQIDGLTPMQALQGTGVSLWEPGGREYMVDTLVFDWDRAHIEGQASLGANPPFTLQAQARIRARADDARLADWTAEARATGPLAAFDLQATLRGTARRAQAAAPALDVDAGITPLDAWPIGRLRLRTQALDLSALLSGAHPDRAQRPHGHRQPLAQRAAGGHHRAGQRVARALERRPGAGEPPAGPAAQPRRRPPAPADRELRPAAGPRQRSGRTLARQWPVGRPPPAAGQPDRRAAAPPAGQPRRRDERVGAAGLHAVRPALARPVGGGPGTSARVVGRAAQHAGRAHRGQPAAR